jgi:hypothetical protein
MSDDTDTAALRTQLEAIIKEVKDTEDGALDVTAFRLPDSSLRKRRLRPLP